MNPPSLQPHEQLPRALALIDYEDHDRGGHYGAYLTWFAREFSTRFDKVLVFTPHPERTGELIESAGQGIPGNVSFHRLPPGARKLFFRSKRHPCLPGLVFKEAGKLAPGHSLQGFIMWGFDLLKIQGLMRDRSGAPWATLGSLSHLKRNCTGRWIKKERGLETICVEHPDCGALLVWDHYLASPQSPKLVWLPGYETSTTTDASPLAASIKAHAGKSFTIGCFGTLSGPRCLNEILPLVQRHPEIKFVLVGALDKKRVEKNFLPLLDSHRPENLLLVTGFHQDEDFNAGIDACDAIFIDGINYPLHSGIVTKALLLGKCVFTPESNSWTHDMIRDHGVGVAYADRGLDFTEAWKVWRESGGPQRSVASAKELIRPRRIADCFDEVTRRLVSALR